MRRLSYTAPPPLTTTIERIMELAGDMPDKDAHRRYLTSLDTYQLTDRLDALRASGDRQATGWQGGGSRKGVIRAHA